MKLDLGGVGQGGEWTTVNLDMQLRPAPDVVLDIRASAAELDICFQRETVDAMRCIHTLEHLPAAEILPTLKYWREFLKPGGELLIVVPDLGLLARDYVARRIPMEVLAAVAYVPGSRVKSPLEEHRWGWDETSLFSLVREAGFREWYRAGEKYWPATWTLDFEDCADTGLVGRYEVPNLRVKAVK